MRNRVRASLGFLAGFEAAARTLSFTQAAAELSLTQSAISRQIAALEELIGVRLFVRHNRRLELTSAGEILARSVRSMLRDYEQALQSIQPDSTRHRVTISTTVSFASLWLVPHLAAFRKEHPGIDVHISADNAVLNLADHDIDLAIRFGRPESVPAGAVTLFGEHVMPVCAPTLVHNHKPPLKEPEDLRHHVLLHLLDTSFAPWLDWRQWGSANGLEDLRAEGNLTFSHYDQLIAAAVAGEGIALGRLPLLQQMVDTGKLITPFKGTAAVPRTYALVRNEARQHTPYSDAFVQWLIKTAKA